MKTLATFTLRSLKDNHACEAGYDRLFASLPENFPKDQPINLLSALASNSVQDVFWALRAVEQDLSSILGLLSTDIAEAVLPIFEKAYPHDDRPRKAIEAARSGNPDTSAAYSAASRAARAAAYSAASTTASTTASRAARAAAAYAARASASAARAADAAAASASAADAASAARATADAADAAADAARADADAARADAYADFDQTLIKILKTYFSEE